MKKNSHLFALCIMALALFGTGCAGKMVSRTCETVNAELHSNIDATDCTSPIGACTRGYITDGVLKGTTQYVTYSMAPAVKGSVDSPSVFNYTGTLTIKTDSGVLVLSDKGVLDHRPDGPLVQYEVPISSAGSLAGVHGTLFVNGFERHDGKGFDSTITGTLCK